MKALVLAGAVLAATALALTGCADPNTERIGTGLYETQLTLNNGNTITCIKYLVGNAGGLSCDWENAK